MGNLTTGTAANVIVGPARLLVAPKGSTVPTLVGPVTWDTAWKEVGYTESGTDMSYNPTIKDIMVDEEMAPVQKILDAEKATISAKLAESTMKNLNYAIAASILTTDANLSTVEVGSGSLTEVMVGLEGKSPSGLQRIIIGFRAIAQANVQMSFQRGAKTIIPVEFGLLADSTKQAGKRLFVYADFAGAGS